MSAPEQDVVSVVIPTHNRRDRLLKAIASVKRQTWPHVEIVVVDDGSNDGTFARLKDMAACDSALRVIRNETSQGGAGARNQGIAAASGRWIAFLDDDDLWLPAKLEKQLVLLKANESASAASCSFFVRAPLRRRRVVRVNPDVSEQEMLRGNCFGGASVCFTSAGMLKGIGGFDATLRSGQDWDLWLRLSRAGPIVACQEPLALYEAHLGRRIVNDIRSHYSGRRRTYFRYRYRMSVETRKGHRAALIFCRMFLNRPRMQHLMVAVKQIFRLVGIGQSLRFLRWYASARLAGWTRPLR
jgi:glycosyltransferase involved in cell wall biosynthesis